MQNPLELLKRILEGSRVRRTVLLLLLLPGTAACLAGNRVEIKIKSSTQGTTRPATTVVSSPVALDPKQIKNGARIFEQSTCSGCHPGGANSLHPNKPLKGPGFQARYRTDAQIEKVIRAGINNTGMPSFGKAQINDKDMKDLIVFIRSLSGKASK